MRPPLAIQVINRSVNISTQIDFEGDTSYDWQAFEPLLATENNEEGTQAFAEGKYGPAISGR